MKTRTKCRQLAGGSYGFVLLGVLTLLATACGDNNGNGNDNVGVTPTPTVTPTLTPSPPPSATVTPTFTPSPPPSPETPTPTPTPAGEACPSKLSFEATVAGADLDTGWTGIAHDQGVVGDGILTVQVTSCENTARPCGVCSFTGPIRNLEKANNQRCSGDTSVECTSDGECTGKGTCAFFFGAPLPLSSGAVPVCVVNRVVGDISGTADIESGDALTAVLNLISSVHNGIQVDQPCPICEGDSAPFDASRDGTCSGGARDGEPCDVGGRSPVFGNTSFDCPPLADANIGNLQIKLGPMGTTTFTRTLTEASPECTALGWEGTKCFCDTCATAEAEPCATDADCPGGAKCGGKRCSGGSANGSPCTTGNDCPGGGFCSRRGLATAGNQCPGTFCDVSSGTCPDQVDQLCDVERFRGCSNNADCPKPGDTCTIVSRPCYVDNGLVGNSVSVAGAPSVPVNKISTPTMATLFCIPPTSAAAVNSAAGLPGLGRLILPGTAKQRD